MRKLHLVLVCLLLLAVVLSGCVGKQPKEDKQASQGPTLEGNITVPGENDLPIEDVQTSQDESVDLGSLI
ncbi:MAG: hypothetical protein OIN66_06325 [Candidatus Methanoperedens sp.]|nr:hypothetical protein [Candidatus Methanoperedens sp.]